MINSDVVRKWLNWPDKTDCDFELWRCLRCGSQVLADFKTQQILPDPLNPKDKVVPHADTGFLCRECGSVDWETIFNSDQVAQSWKWAIDQ